MEVLVASEIALESDVDHTDTAGTTGGDFDECLAIGGAFGCGAAFAACCGDGATLVDDELVGLQEDRTASATTAPTDFSGFGFAVGGVVTIGAECA